MEISKSGPDQWYKVKRFDDVNQGDHVCYYRFPYYRHGIIIETDRATQIVKLLRYHIIRREIDEEKIKYNSREFYVLDNASRCEINLQKAIYSGPCFKSDSVVQRARARHHEKQYDPITNFARAFPRWCKTGKGGLTAISPIKLHEGREVIHQIEDLTKGDHIMFDRGPYFHHAIVMDVVPVENKLELVHFCNGKCANCKCCSVKVRNNTKTRQEESGTLFRLTYNKLTEITPDQVALRAKVIKEKDQDYTLVGSNCEHLATWCKIGIWESVQVRQCTRYVLWQFFAFIMKLLKLIPGVIVDKSTNVYVEIRGENADTSAGMTYCVIDLIYFACIIYSLRGRRNEFQKDDFKCEVYKLVCTHLLVISLVLVGSIFFQLFWATPVLNAFVGGLAGYILGLAIIFAVLLCHSHHIRSNEKIVWRNKKGLKDTQAESRV